MKHKNNIPLTTNNFNNKVNKNVNEDNFESYHEEKYTTGIRQPVENRKKKVEGEGADNMQSLVQGKEICFRMGDFIGSGSFGQVYRAMNVDTGMVFAVRKIPIGIRSDQHFITSLDVAKFFFFS